MCCVGGGQEKERGAATGRQNKDGVSVSRPSYNGGMTILLICRRHKARPPSIINQQQVFGKSSITIRVLLLSSVINNSHCARKRFILSTRRCHLLNSF